MINKKACAALMKMHKRADGIGKAIGSAWGVSSGAYSKAMGLVATMAPLVAIAAGYGAARTSSPNVIANKDVTDKELELNALVTEMAAAQRQLDRMDKKSKPQPRRIYDKVAGESMTV